MHRDTMEGYVYGERASKRCDIAPRGYAKTTHKALIKPIHDLCYKLETYIVIFSNTDAQAVKKIKDIKTELDTNHRLRRDYGNFLQNKRTAETQFTAKNGKHRTRFEAYSSKTEVRGIRFGQHRPSKIVVDDFEHSTEVNTEEVLNKYKELFNESISKLGNENTNIEVIGTLLHRKALLADLRDNPVYSTRIYKAIISWSSSPQLWTKWREIYCNIEDPSRKEKAKKYFQDNEQAMMEGVQVLWPEKEPYYFLMEEIIQTGMRAFKKEKQNDPVSDEEKVFDPEKFHYAQEREEGFFIEKTGLTIHWKDLICIGVIDPATGKVKPTKNKKVDYSCMLVGYMDRFGRLIVGQDFTKRCPPSEYIAKIFEWYDIFGYEDFGVEINLFRELLMQNINDEKKRLESVNKKTIPIRFQEIDNIENKEKRIYTLEPKVNNGWIIFSRSLSQEFMDQVIEFPKHSHDDCPDALEMLWNMGHNSYSAGGIKKEYRR